MAYHSCISYSTLDSSAAQLSPLADLRHNFNVFDEMSPGIFTKAAECDSLESTSSVPAIEIQVGPDSIEIDPVDYADSARTTLSNNEDKVFDQISQGIDTGLWYQSADDVPFPIHSAVSPLLPSSVEQLNAHVLFPEVEPPLKEDTAIYVNQMFAKSPQRATAEQLITPFASLVPGDKFHISRILVVPVSDTFR
nr:uncharacterized protein LOC104120212 [Nicotiana tomentosiformis]